MGLLDRHKTQQAAGQQSADPRQGFQQMQQNPGSFFGRLGVNIPEGMTDAQQIIDHLRRSGQIPSNVFNAAMQLYNRRPQK